MLGRHMPSSCIACVCVCVCACLSVTLRYFIKTAKHKITQIMSHDSPIGLYSFLMPKITAKFELDRKCKWGELKSASFNEKLAITRKQYKTDA